MVSLSVSMKMFEMWEFTNSADRFSIANAIIVLVILLLFILMVAYFTLFRMKNLRALYILKKRRQNKEVLESLHKTWKQGQRKKISKDASNVLKMAIL